MPILPHLRERWLVWECAAGDGNLVRGMEDHGHVVVGSDVDDGRDFLRWTPERYDCIVTHPPHSQLTKFIGRAYELGKPFAFLMPIHALDTPKRQAFFRMGLELIILPERVCFCDCDGKALDKWILAWFTWKLHIGSALTFYPGMINIFKK
jgi:hypothetical protein